MMIFLTSKSGKQHAILNSSQICYMEGIEETEEHPDGSQTKFLFPGGHLIIETPYRDIADQIADAIKHAYTTPYQIDEERRKRIVQDTGNMMREVMREFHSPTS